MKDSKEIPMRRILYLFLFFFIPLQAVSESEACARELEQIDVQIKKLNAEKQKHTDLAIKYQKQGDNWQYSTGRIEDAHKAWGKANEEQKKAIDLQLQIDALLEKKERIYQFYPELWHP